MTLKKSLFERRGFFVGGAWKDTKEKITGIQWTVYGKIKQITMTGKTISYGYDAAGNRITKTVAAGSTTTTTFYSRDAQGNTMAVYTSAGSNFTWDEQHLYGSSRLGIWKPGIVAKQNGIGDSKTAWGRSGDKFFELSNHLGNVLATVSDKVTGVNNDSDPEADYYVADVVSANDYYPFGMLMPGRKFNAGSYRFGYGGKEKDDEIKGEGNSIDYGARMYDSRLGRWLSIDKQADKYPDMTPYGYSLNNPIKFTDLDGNLVRDESGRIIFTKTQSGVWWTTMQPQTYKDPNTGKVYKYTVGFTVDKGYALDNSGKKVEIMIATSNQVQIKIQEVTKGANGKEQLGEAQYITNQETQGLDNSYNCVGNCIADAASTINIYGAFGENGAAMTEQFMKQDSYVLSDVKNATEGDVGAYVGADGVFHHVEKFLANGNVAGKGGIAAIPAEAKPGTNETFSKGNKYKVYKKSMKDKVVSATGDVKVTLSSNTTNSAGYREVSSSDMNKVQQAMKPKKKK
ncbi:RHS repeat domain-containing protein [Foetidibacter luteolus]|uniref:RHS repeat domain-containing protein n=1 Tax=Foetidibacter luteolus TaxID=2608880 RepID=UPI00129B55E7|nr:RHS repeat-associated core domain-containing protein [Foetidibacter luteolus]